MLSLDVLERAQGWIQHDPNPTTVRYVQDLLNPKDEEHVSFCQQRLNSLFPHNRLLFGTAGLRGRMKPGPIGMNDLVVVQTAQGLARYVIQEHCTTTTVKECSSSLDDCSHQQHPGICAVVGYDHRSSIGEPYDVSSLSFAIYTALVFREAGIDCFLLDGFVPTPIVSYGVLRYVPEQMRKITADIDSDDEIQRQSSSETTRDNRNAVKAGVEDHCSTKIAIGVMVTASHNPAKDAGYKVFWTDGCQIRSPTDKGITASIQENLVPWTDYGKMYSERKIKFPNDPCLGLSRPEETRKLLSHYYQAILDSGLVTGVTKRAKPDNHHRSLVPKFCYTAMHGVGHKFVQQAFAQFGLPALVSVPSQEQPDPRFPTVDFPNPEEQGALELAKKFALENDCVFVLANDPDADRLGVSEYNPTTGEWMDFTGDQIGLLLGHWLWTQYQNQDGGIGRGTIAGVSGNVSSSKSSPYPTTPGGDEEDSTMLPVVSMCSSTVSSQVLATMAREEGFHHEETLPGFKWIGSKAAELAKSGKYRQLFCYEESLGYCCGDVVFDKDGITACAVLVELAMHVYDDQTDSQTDMKSHSNHLTSKTSSRRSSLLQHLQSLYERYGEFVSRNGYFILDDPSKIPLIMDHITDNGKFNRSRIPKIHSSCRGISGSISGVGIDSSGGTGSTLEDGDANAASSAVNDDKEDDIDYYEIASIRYLGQPGYDSTRVDSNPQYQPVLPTSSSSPMVTIHFTNGGVAQFRASGTEPKFKYYLELRGKPGVDRATVQQELEEWSQAVLLEYLLPTSRFGLQPPPR